MLVTNSAMVLNHSGGLVSGTIASPIGEVLMIPPSVFEKGNKPSLKQLPWHSNHKILLAEMCDLRGYPWEHCPKSCLRKAVNILHLHDLKVQLGFELEFILLEQGGTANVRPIPDACGYASFDLLDDRSAIIDEMIAILTEMDIPVNLMHAEGGQGQFEIVLGHKYVLEAVDDLVIAREVIRSVARRHKLVATFVPKLGPGFGTGSHVHISVDGHFGVENECSGDLKSISTDMSKTGESFLAGVLDGLPWLTFLINASPASYVRLVPGSWAGVYQAWGVNHKDLPIRLSNDRTNFELKPLDGVSNPYLAMAGTLMAGLNGVKNGMNLPAPCQIDPMVLPAEERPERLPCSLPESMGKFMEVMKSGILAEVFSDDMVHDLLEVKKSDILLCQEHGIDEFVKMMATMH